MSREYRAALLDQKGIGLATAIGTGALIVGAGTALAAWGAKRQRRRNALRKQKWIGAAHSLGVRPRRR